MIQAGFGIGFGQRGMAEMHEDIVEINPDMDIGTIPVWLTAHKELRMSPRVRLCFDHLADCFAAL